jgi:ribosomal protein L11 methyltransferase
VCFEVRAESAPAGEAALADAFDAGAAGLEERDGEAGAIWLLYAAAAAAPAVAAALARFAPAVRAAAAAAVPEEDWSERWKEGLAAIEISPLLRVRPSFVRTALARGQAEVVIDPAQAFGTGGHESTRLALEWIAELAPGLPPGARVLDVGCGSGVLALAALRLGAAQAVALDLDPLAAAAARENAAHNALSARTHVLLGTLAALRPVGFALVVANLLRSELLPLLGDIAQRTAREGHAVLSGLLAAELPRVEEACARAGLRRLAARERADASGERWAALLTAR